MTTRMTKPIAAFLMALTLILGACSGSYDSDEGASETTAASFDEISGSLSDGDGATEGPAAPTDGGEAIADTDTLGSGGVDAAVLQTSTLGREIIFTADMTVAVTDVAAASAEATSIIEDLGGYLFGQETTGLPEPRSVLTFKVLPGDFQQALARLGSVGEIRTQSVSADDVTDKVVDLESRIDTAAASVERLKGFLEEAQDIETIAELESQLLLRETDLETMRGQLRTLRDRIDLATIYLTLTEALSNPSVALRISGFPGHDEGVSCPGDGGIAVDEGETATVCFEVINTGDTPLASFELKDTVLGVELGDLIVVWGDPDGILEPGQSLVLAYEITVDKNLRRTQSRVAAEPVDQDGNRVEGREVASTAVLTVTAIDPGGLPGFRDGLEASWGGVVWVGGVLVLLAGAIVPLIVPLALLAGLWLWFARRQSSRDPRPAEKMTVPWSTKADMSADETSGDETATEE